MAKLTDISHKSYFISLALLLMALLLSLLISLRGKPVVVQTNLEKLPMVINGMQGVDDSFSDAVYKELNADKHIYRHYRSVDGKQVDLYIGYYGTAKGGRTGHNPMACLPSQGWGMIWSSKIVLNPKIYPEGVPVRYLVASKDDLTLTTLCWYQAAGQKVYSDGIQQNIQSFLGRVLRNRNDGAYIQISIFSDKENIEASKASVKRFSECILDLLQQNWPVEN